jgi:hypothetical protein
MQQLARVDRLMDGRDADAELLGDRRHWQKAFGSQELRPPQVRRNSVGDREARE